MQEGYRWKNPGILIVDDNATDARVLESMLRQEGEYRFLHARNGAEALEKLGKDEVIDLSCSMFFLPDITGVEVCRQIKGDPNTAGISVVLISGIHKNDESIARGLEAGGRRLSYQARGDHGIAGLGTGGATLAFVSEGTSGVRGGAFR